MHFERVNYFGIDAKLHYGNVTISGERIASVEMISEHAQSGAKLLLSGCIDTHTHAMLQSEYFAEDESAARKARQALAKSGTTSFLFATMAMGEEALSLRCRAAGEAVAHRGEGESRCLGVYLEGPFISYEKRGAHNPELLHEIDGDMLKRLDEAAHGSLRAVCMAPELEGALELGKRLSGERVVSFAHSAADYDLARAAFDAGFSNLTHTFNCMQPLLHRAPGPIAAAADTEHVTAELIADTLHVQPPMVRLLFKLFGWERIILISDSISVCGLSDGVYTSADGMRTRLANGRATVDGTDTLAGSVTPLFEGIKRMASCGIPLEHAIAAATLNPARRYGFAHELGAVEEGYLADLLLCSSTLELERVLIGGEEVE